MLKRKIAFNCTGNAHIPETTWSLKIGTVAAIILGLMSMAIAGLSTWTGYISSKVASHGEEIAVLKANNANILATVTRVESVLDDIRKEQMRRAKAAGQ